MKTHREIEDRSLAMARAIVEKIDADPLCAGLDRAREVCRRWWRKHRSAAIEEWVRILERPWEEVRTVLLDPSERGRRLRQSGPFCGILTPQERWEIYKVFKNRDA